MERNRPEWSENWQSWPHCNGQASCWMHYSRDGGGAWCRCRCVWCRIARRIRPSYAGRV